MKNGRIFEIKNMSYKHIDSMLRVEQSSKENFWNKTIFTKHLRMAGHGGFVAMSGKELVGFIAFEHLADSIQIWNLVVSSRFRRLGVSRSLLGKLKEKVPDQCLGLRFNVRESNLIAQNMLKSAGFKCKTISRRYFVEKIKEEIYYEDAYCFDFNKVSANKALKITDRIGAVIAEPYSGKERVPFGVPYWTFDRQNKA